MSIKSRVISALRWTALFRLSGQFTTWAITLYVIRILDPQDYGLVTMATVFVGFAMLINELGVIPALVQTDKVSDFLVRQVFGTVLLWNFLQFAILFAGAPFFAAAFQEERLVDIIRVLSLSVLIGSFASVPAALLRREINFKKLSAVEFVSMLASSFTTLGLALNGAGVWSLVFGTIAHSAVKCIGNILVTRFRMIPTFRFTGMGSMFSFGSKITAQSVLWYFCRNFDVILIGRFLGHEALGIYNVALDLARLPMTKVAAIVQQVAFSAYSRIQDNIEQVRRYFLATVEIACMVMFPLLWGLSSVSPEFVPVVLGETWLAATPVLRIVCLIVPFQFISLLLYPLLDGLGHPGVSLRNLVTACFIVPVVLFTGVQWGLVGVSVAFVIGTLIVQAINYRRSLPVLDCRFGQLAMAMLPSIYCVVTMYCAVTIAREFLVHLPDVWRLPLLIVVGAATYTGMTLLTNRKAVSKSMSLLRPSASS